MTSSSRNALPYTHGLTGVNLGVNDITTRGLWASAAGLAAVVLVIRLLRSFHHYLRLTVTIPLTPAQHRYWARDVSFWSKIKRDLLQAPLLHSRHNKEIQLSRAVSIGTLPSRLHTLLLVAFLMSNVVYCLLLDYHGQSKAALIAEIRGRSGHLAVINMLMLVLFAARNNPFIPVLAVSFDTFNLFHRWIGRVIVLESVVHIIAWFVNNRDAIGFHGIMEVFMTDPFVQCGLASTIALLVILVQSPSPVRHAFYEVFLHTHQMLAVVALGATAAHIQLQNLPQKPIIYTVIGIWASERVLRVLRLIYYNVSYRGLTRVHVEALDGGACRVTFEIRRPFTTTPGRHIYAYIPSISFWMSHPFSVAMVNNNNNASAFSSTSTPSQSKVESFEKADSEQSGSCSIIESSSIVECSEGVDSKRSGLESIVEIFEEPAPKPSTTAPTHTVSCIMAARTGMTQKLYNRARSSPKGIYTCHAFIEGPYGASESLDSYGTVLLFAGGVGITNQLSHMHHLIQGWAAGTCATQKLILVWSVRSLEQLEWARPFLEQLSRMDRHGRELEIVTHVTQLRGAGGFTERPHMTIRPGRADVGRAVDQHFEERIGAMSIGVCGPGALADDVRKAARAVMGKGKVDFWEEAFTW